MPLPWVESAMDAATAPPSNRSAEHSGKAMSGHGKGDVSCQNDIMAAEGSLLSESSASLLTMSSEKLYTIVLEHSLEVLLEAATMAQVEAFWDVYDTRYFGLRMEEENSHHARVIVTDEMPEEEEADLCIG
jgi:uncharacterized protein YlaN (UPF0358 family)